MIPQSLIINSNRMYTHRKPSGSNLSSVDSTRVMPELREGDWICVNCSNLNFSFRTICNRCKVQTKEANYSYYYNFIITPPRLDSTESMDPAPLQQEEEVLGFEQNKENHKAFQSALLLTPTKNQQNAEMDAPYKSPCSLPSVSPLLKKYNSSHLVMYSTQSKVSNSIDGLQINKFDLDRLSRDESEYDQEMNSQINQLLSEIQIDM